jgi:hypothetical protein
MHDVFINTLQRARAYKCICTRSRGYGARIQLLVCVTAHEMTSCFMFFVLCALWIELDVRCTPASVIGSSSKQTYVGANAIEEVAMVQFKKLQQGKSAGECRTLEVVARAQGRWLCNAGWSHDGNMSWAHTVHGQVAGHARCCLPGHSVAGAERRWGRVLDFFVCTCASTCAVTGVQPVGSHSHGL